MVKVFKGDPKGNGLKIGVVVSEFNESVTGKLLDGALAVLREGGVREEDIHIAKVPGAFEIPLAASQMARSGEYSGLICLGAVIRGETPHFEHISREVSRGIADIMMNSGLPVSFGVLTTETVQQAVDRSDPAGYDRGGEAARVVLEMANLLKDISV